jgi:hypothetical protein
MASRPDHPADDPAPDGDEERDAVPGGAGDARVSDEQWAAIVADLRGDTGTGARPGSADPADPAAGPVGQDDPRTASGPAVTYPVAPWVTDRRVVRPARRDDDPPTTGAEGVGATGRDWDATDRMDEAEREVDAAERFSPPEPGPVLGGDPLLTMAWLAVAGVPLLWLVVVVAWRDAPSAVLQASGVVLLLGLGVLLWRMPHRRDDDHDDTDGAVV